MKYAGGRRQKALFGLTHWNGVARKPKLMLAFEVDDKKVELV